jgi:hypothetical protein
MSSIAYSALGIALVACFVWRAVVQRLSIGRAMAKYRAASETVAVVWRWGAWQTRAWVVQTGALLLILPLAFLVWGTWLELSEQTSLVDTLLLAIWTGLLIEISVAGSTPTLLVLDDQGLRMHFAQWMSSVWNLDPWQRRRVAWDEIERFWWVGKERRDALGLQVRVSDRDARGSTVFNFRMAGVPSETKDAIERMLRQHAQHAVAT